MNDAYRVVGSVDKARNRKSGDARIGFFATASALTIRSGSTRVRHDR
jgi:hypothetical protein